jgi:hypothetical protein
MYFFCLGRHGRRTDCTLRSVQVEVVESLVEAEWMTVRLDPEYGALLQRLVEADFDKLAGTNRTRERQITRQLDGKRTQRKELLDAYYAGAIPVDLLKVEQVALTRDIEDLELKLVRSRLKVANLETALRHTLEFLSEPNVTYRSAPVALRRQLNQAVFDRIEVFNAEGPVVIGQTAEPFATVLSGDLIEQVPAQHEDASCPQGLKEGCLAARTEHHSSPDPTLV